MFRKIAMLCLLVPFLSLTVGCSQLNPPGGTDWDRLTLVVEDVTELSARVLFASSSVQPYKDNICKGVGYVAPVLSNFEDPDATFEKLQETVAQAIMEIPSDILNDELKMLLVTVMDNVLDYVFLYVRDSYADLVNQDEARVVLLMSRAIANGLTKACTVPQANFAERLEGKEVGSSCSGCPTPCTK